MTEHGTVGRYTNHKCRCDNCRRAWARYTQQRKFERAILLEQNPTLAPHGIESTYGNWRCRCRACTDAWTAAGRRRKKR